MSAGFIEAVSGELQAQLSGCACVFAEVLR